MTMLKNCIFLITRVFLIKILIMRKYLPQVVDHLIAPKHKFISPLLSPTRYYNKRNHLKICKIIWNYRTEEEINRQIAVAYFSLLEALKQNDQPIALRYLSIELYEQYKQNTSIFQLQEKISDIQIINCNFLGNAGAKETDNETGNSWFYLDVVIKHFTVAKRYGLERRIFDQKFKFQNTTLRKWYFNQLPIVQSNK